MMATGTVLRVCATPSVPYTLVCTPFPVQHCYTAWSYRAVEECLCIIKANFLNEQWVNPQDFPVSGQKDPST